MRNLTLFVLTLIVWPFFTHAVIAKNYVWTDVNGQKIEAAFVRSSSDTLTISMDGQELDLPLDSLSAFSKALAIKLKNETKPADPETKTLHPWKDLQGRIIEAEFISATSSAVKLLWNKQTFDLPLSSLSQESKNLARKLSSNPETKPQDNTVSSQKPIKPANDEVGTDPEGPLDLNNFQIWISADNRSLKAKFIKFENDEVVLDTTSGSEVEIHVDNLSKQAIALAGKLKDLQVEKENKAQAFAVTRKKMKIPTVTNEDLDKVHPLQNNDGVSISASFLDADDYIVSILLKGKSSPTELPWDKFNAESQALIEALRRKSLTANRKPTISPAKGSRLAAFANGPFKGYNTVFQSERFDAALSSTGSGVKIWLKNSKDPTKPPKTFSVGFGTQYTDTSNPEKHRRRSRNITGFENPPEPSMKRDTTTILGTFNNGGKFQYDIQMNDKGLAFWSKMTDPSGEKEPTSIRIGASIPGIVPNSKNLSMKEIMPYIGDGSLVLKPKSGKTRIYPFKEKWAVTGAKYKGQKFGAMESASLMGFPYGNKISFMGSGSGMSFSRDVSYGRIFPFQGLTLRYENGSNRKLISRSNAFKVTVTPN